MPIPGPIWKPRSTSALECTKGDMLGADLDPARMEPVELPDYRLMGSAPNRHGLASARLPL